ncbi:MAG: OadG family protein [Kiritimatiellae bacterium]|jgi:sodium pump decarboxylase gamma subunit|nr:OadG family protein [Kiritimatiellia bacterium]
MFTSGVQIMLVGMGTVFGFLILMVLVMSGTASFLKRFPEAAPVSAPKRSTSGADAEIAAAIAIAKSRIS